MRARPNLTGLAAFALTVLAILGHAAALGAPLFA